MTFSLPGTAFGRDNMDERGGNHLRRDSQIVRETTKSLKGKMGEWNMYSWAAKGFWCSSSKKIDGEVGFPSCCRGRGGLRKWIENYLTGREQERHVRGASRNRARVTSGVFQGLVFRTTAIYDLCKWIPETLIYTLVCLPILAKLWIV